jgi:hypothetical protein
MAVVERNGIMSTPGVGPSVHEVREQQMLALPAAGPAASLIGMSKLIIKAVLQTHRLHKDDFFGPYRWSYLIEARMDAANRLRAAGFSVNQIARIMKRNHTTILNYFPDLREAKRRRLNERMILRKLDPELCPVVKTIAAAEGVTIEILIAQWVGERARYEISQRNGVDHHDDHAETSEVESAAGLQGRSADGAAPEEGSALLRLQAG